MGASIHMGVDPQRMHTHMERNNGTQSTLRHNGRNTHYDMPIPKKRSLSRSKEKQIAPILPVSSLLRRKKCENIACRPNHLLQESPVRFADCGQRVLSAGCGHFPYITVLLLALFLAGRSDSGCDPGVDRTEIILLSIGTSLKRRHVAYRLEEAAPCLDYFWLGMYAGIKRSP
ncbi:hypothetical protein CDAR_297151 [Caerostris darwini]|uniref:Uncharacterized protein n=1 Tax=Caerostris darwini TaxID=1538125 RepID=A0AAV4Q998_9ARAC|nr:hypothetical protein CDAR_297151 [Caerostris darwini]